MNSFVIFDRNEAEKAASEGKKLGLFTMDESGEPVRFVSCVGYSVQPETKSNKYVEKAKKYVEENYRDIGTADLARYCDVSAAHLSRLFSLYAGMTITEYILSVRMSHAARLLTETDEKVVAIAREVGIPDCGYFNKKFRSFFGMTPLSYRNSAVLSLE